MMSMLPMVGPRGVSAGTPTLDSGARKAFDDRMSVVGSGGAVTANARKKRSGNARCSRKRRAG